MVVFKKGKQLFLIFSCMTFCLQAHQDVANYSFTDSVLHGIIQVKNVFVQPFLDFFSSSICDFDEQEHTQFILTLFKQEWHWLVDRNLSFDPAYMLNHREGLTIKVACKNGRNIGFIVYYKNLFGATGEITCLAVSDTFRSQGWGYAVLKHAVRDLKNQGAHKVHLVAFADNSRAQKLYSNFGFDVAHQNGRHIHFIYSI